MGSANGCYHLNICLPCSATIQGKGKGGVFDMITKQHAPTAPFTDILRALSSLLDSPEGSERFDLTDLINNFSFFIAHFVCCS